MSPSTISHIAVSWEDALSGNFPPNPTKQLFTNTVIAVTAEAKAAMPEANGRVERARDLVLGHLVHQTAEGYTVRSQSARGKTYTVTADGCNCPDAAKLESGHCKHLIATWIWRRARKAVEAQLATSNGHTPPAANTVEVAGEESVALATNRPAPQPPLPEAPASVNVEVKVEGRWARITLRDTDEHRLLTRLEALMQRFPIEAEATQPPAEGWCSKHGLQMTQQHNAKGAWWSHRLADGTWCKGK